MLMGLEMPALSATIARMDDPKTQLAAFGIIFPVALLIESPIMMMLAASTKLSTDLRSYLTVRRYMTIISVVLTLFHAALVFTPLFDLVIVTLLDPPHATIEPVRRALFFLLPWTWAIADRRFHQGLLIRFGRSRTIGIGTVIRLMVTILMLVVVSMEGSLSGVETAALALSMAVIAEAIYVRIVSRDVIRGPLTAAKERETPITPAFFRSFYIPLALTPMVGLLALPLAVAGIAQMPNAMDSLAAWPVIGGTVFLSRCTGMAFNEVTVTLAGRPGGTQRLQRFGWVIGALFSLGLLVLAATPASHLLFQDAINLSAPITAIAVSSILLAIPLPILTFIMSFRQGLLVHRQETRGITEAVILSVITLGTVLWIGTQLNTIDGARCAIIAMVAGATVQVIWLRFRSGPAT
jgi:hypothetical protein